ncbi:hypothetical protein Ndes2526B_g08402 [Nannochloris sp. 'desiccata']|nr:putative Thiol-disulfide oxidoreductase LTO1 [Chlorella desiccata (nom. nud.)]
MALMTSKMSSLLALSTPVRGLTTLQCPRINLSNVTHRSKRVRLTQASNNKKNTEPSTSGREQQNTRRSSTRLRAPFPFAPVAALASLGALETGYLAVTKLLGGVVACPLYGGCASVLTSDYASLWGTVPLSAVGMLVYGGVVALSIAGIGAVRRNDEDAETPLRTAVLAGGLLLGTTSAYLMYILFTAFPGELCPWCIGSAALSTGIVALTITGLQPRELEEAAAPCAGLAAATLLALTLALGTPDASQAGTGITELEYKQPVVTTESPPEATSLAARLREAGAQMYGAFWCSHCYDQKQIFGQEAMSDFPYVECFPGGWKQGVEMAPACKAANLEGFPTWVVGSEKLEGAKSLEELQAALDKLEANKTRVAPLEAAF